MVFVAFDTPDPFLDNFLIVSDTGRAKDLYQIHLTTGVMLPLKIGATKLNSVAFDDVRKVVYWTDIDSGMIRKYPITNGNRRIETIFTSTAREWNNCAVEMTDSNINLNEPIGYLNILGYITRISSGVEPMRSSLNRLIPQ